jgi:hypothetical protein
VLYRGGKLVDEATLGTWEYGSEWGGYATLAGVLHATGGEAVAVVQLAEHDGPDTGSASIRVYQVRDGRLGLAYTRDGQITLTDGHAVVDGVAQVWTGQKLVPAGSP